MSGKLDEFRNMSRAINWQDEIEVIAGPYSGNRKHWLSQAARRAGVSYRQIKGLFYAETNDPKLSVASKVLSAAEQARLEEARRDARMVAEILYRHAETLAQTDEDFHRNSIDGLIETARAISNRDRTGDRE